MSTVAIAALLRKQSRISEINLKRNLQRKEATGQLRRQLGYRISSDATSSRMVGMVNASGFPYWKVIDRGTKAPFKGIMPETAGFRAWLKARNIDKSASFPIRRAIPKRGLKPTWVFTDENKQTMAEIRRELPPLWMAEVRTRFNSYRKI